MEGTDRLLEAAKRFKELRARLAEEWPACSPEEEQEALAQVRRGEGMELDEAFAQIAGVDKATWLQRVAAHQQKQCLERRHANASSPTPAGLPGR